MIFSPWLRMFTNILNDWPNTAKPTRTFIRSVTGYSKSAIFDIYGITEAGNPVLIEVQQNFNTLFIDRLIYYTSRVVSRTVKKSKDYNLPHIYVLSLLTENQFPLERSTYLHHAQLVRNRRLFYEKLDIYLIEIEKFFAIDDRTKPENREMTDRAEMLRIFRDVLEEKEIPVEKLQRLLDKDFAKDVSLQGYTDETLLNEVDGMTDLLYEKQGSYQQGLDDRGRQDAQLMVDKGILTPEKAAELFHVLPKDILPSKQ